MAFVRFLLVALVACAPQIDGPIERQRVIDRDDSGRLETQLAALPGALRASVTLHRPAIDPLTEVATPPSAAVLVVVDDAADRRAITRSAISLVRGTAPEIAEPSIVVEIGARHVAVETVGPFTVDARSKPALVLTFACAFTVIAAMAAWLAWRERWRVLRR